MFEYKYTVPKNELKTTYGSISIRNIIFDPGELEKVLPDIIFEDENLKHMFAENDLSDFKKRNIYRRFIPKVNNIIEMEQFIQNSINNNKTFYSFLAEGILGLVFRDLYAYSLAKGVIDVNETLTDSHTGVDACMYNLENQVIVLGEAKFYGSFDEGIERIIQDFVSKNIRNKLESLQTISQICEESNTIIIKNLSIDDYDEITIEQFMSQRIIFAGFVLHSEKDISHYNDSKFYDKHLISTQQLEANIRRAVNNDSITCNYEIIMVHLPIKDKKSLIAKIIETAQDKLTRM